MKFFKFFKILFTFLNSYTVLLLFYKCIITRWKECIEILFDKVNWLAKKKIMNKSIKNIVQAIKG